MKPSYSGRTLSGMRRLALLGTAMLLAAAPTPLTAAESELSNIGFMENPPKALKERFPMCDAFLKVEWIDKEKMIGSSRYELYRNGRKDGEMRALIYMGGAFPNDRIELYDFEKKGELQTLFASIKSGELVSGAIPVVKYGTYEAALYSHNTAAAGFSYSDNRKNVCIPYPDNQRMWLVEGRQVGMFFSQQQVTERFNKLKRSLPRMQLSRFKETNAIDLNHDGIDDYMQREWIIYSGGDHYFAMTRTKYGLEGVVRFAEWSFPPSIRSCVVKPWAGAYITTDGKNYYLNNQCNLTEMTSPSEKQ